MRGFRVAVIDCDYPQYSVLRQRQRDTASAEASALVRQRLEAQFGRLDRQPYPVLAARPQTALREWEQYAARGQESCQAVLFDLPGTMGTEGVLSTLAALDYLVVPLKADRMVLESSLNFAATLNDRLITTGASRLRGIFLFWNLVAASATVCTTSMLRASPSSACGCCTAAFPSVRRWAATWCPALGQAVRRCCLPMRRWPGSAALQT